MGNTWEFQDETILKSISCPCGKGAYVEARQLYNDDYCKNHYSDVKEIRCNECRLKYEYYENHWLTKEIYKTIKEMESSVSDIKKDSYMKLYYKYFASVINYFKTKKGLYDFLYKNKLFHVPGTIQTFYKNGINHYISNNSYSYLNFDDLVQLISLSTGLLEDDIQMINVIRLKEDNIKNFMLSHSA